MSVAGKGKLGDKLYKTWCAGCHDLNPSTKPVDVGPKQDLEPLAGLVIPQGRTDCTEHKKASEPLKRFITFPTADTRDELSLGTDPSHAETFSRKVPPTTPLLALLDVKPREGGSDIMFSDTLFDLQRLLIDSEALLAGFDDGKVCDMERRDLRGTFVGRDAKRYPARPLAGIWASAPYLHNGSVPTLWDLLSPVRCEKRAGCEARPATFMLRSQDQADAGVVFDSVKVGLTVVPGPSDAKLCKEPQCFNANGGVGTSNAGHDRRTLARVLAKMGKSVPDADREDFSKEEKRALVEFLKVKGEVE
jgi:hypothetical protein